MGLFENMLGDRETVFRNPVVLDYDYVPKLVPYREKEQFHMASCIKPLFQNRSGKNLLIFGRPGVGKTVACKHVLKELEEKTDDVVPLYVNCWQKNTTFKIILEICDLIGYKFTQNKKTNELFDVIKRSLNKKSVVFVFDEIDKVEDFDFLYTILEEIYRKSIFLITSKKEWSASLDSRIKSRLIPEFIEFRAYNSDEIRGILKNRIEDAFFPGVMGDDAFEPIVQKTSEIKDLRSGLYLLRESGNAAEDCSSRKIRVEHVVAALKKLEKASIKKSDGLEDETKFILEIIKKRPETKIGELYRKYQEAGGKSTYKTFKRKITRLKEGGYVTVETLTGGIEGSTSIVGYKKIEDKKLTDY